MIPSPMANSCHGFRSTCFVSLQVSPNHSFRTTMKMVVRSPSGKSVSTNRHGVVPKELGNFNHFQELLHNRFLWEAIKCVCSSCLSARSKLPKSCSKDVNRFYQTEVNLTSLVLQRKHVVSRGQVRDREA